MHTITDKKLLMLKPDDIISSPHRARSCFDPYELKALADSIQSNGIIEPLIIRRNHKGSFELIAGERRLRAARLAGIRRVPCVLHKADDTTAALYSIIENIRRSNLSFFEEAYALDRLCKQFGISKAELAARLGMAQSTLCNKLRILRLDDTIKDRIISAGLTERHARALLRLPEAEQDSALDKIIAGGLNLKQTETLITEILTPAEAENIEEQPANAPMRKAAIGDIRLFANSLSKLLNTMQSAGIDARSKTFETEKYVEYKVRITKNTPERYTQLKIC